MINHYLNFQLNSKPFYRFKNSKYFKDVSNAHQLSSGPLKYSTCPPLSVINVTMFLFQYKLLKGIFSL